MKTKTLTLVGLILCLAISAFAQNDKMKDDKMMKNATPEQMLMSMERSAWQALENKHYDEFAAMLTDDYQGYYSDQTATKATQVAQVRQVTFKNLVLSDMKVQFADKDAAIVTTTVKGDTVTPDGKTMSSTDRTTTVWVKRGNRWMIIYHSDIPMHSGDKMDKMNNK